MRYAVSDRLISEPDAAEALGVSPRTVRRYAQQEIIELVRVGTRRRYRVSEIEQIIRHGTRPVRRGGAR